MPIDFQSIQDEQEKNLRDLLAFQKSGVAGNLARYKDAIESGRNAYLNQNYDPLVSTPAGVESRNYETSRLRRALEPTLAGIGFGQERNVLGRQQSDVNRILQDRRNAYLATQAYGRQQMFTNQAQKFESSEAAQNRRLKEELDQIASDYAARGLELEESFTPQSDYESAILRALGVLVGTGGSIAAYRYADRKKSPYVPGRTQPNYPVSNNVTLP